MTTPSDSRRRAVYFLVFAAMAASLTAGSYFLVARLLKDRQSAMSHQERRMPDSRRGPVTRTVTQNGKTVTTTVNNTPGQPSATNAGEAAVQRQLKTLDEINKINEMNRRLMDQQRRMQNQR